MGMARIHPFRRAGALAEFPRSAPAFPHELRHEGDNALQRHLAPLPRRAILELGDAVPDAAPPHDHLIRKAHEVGLRELHARALLAVVEERLDSRLGKARCDALGDGPDLVVQIEREHAHLVGRDGDGPDDAVLVVVLLHDGGIGARHAHAVAAHLEGSLLAVGVEEGGMQGL